MSNDDSRKEPRFSIGVVCRRTGLKADRLRAWERRYGVVEPERSDGNQRLYSEADIERLSLLRRATESGHRIAHVANLAADELTELVARDSALAFPPMAFAPTAREISAAGSYMTRCLAAVQQLDAELLRMELEHASGELSGPGFIQELLVPLIERIGDLWEEGGLRVAHEHLATTVVRSFVDGMRKGFDSPSAAARVLVTTPSGERHELGALLAVATAAGDGWNVTYLGPDLPAAEIAAAARQKGASVVGLSVVAPADHERVGEELRRLRRHLGVGVDLVVGGRGAPRYEAVLDEIGAVVVNDLARWRRALIGLLPQE